MSLLYQKHKGARHKLFLQHCTMRAGLRTQQSAYELQIGRQGSAHSAESGLCTHAPLSLLLKRLSFMHQSKLSST